MEITIIFFVFFLGTALARDCRDFHDCDYIKNVQGRSCDEPWMQRDCPVTCGACGKPPPTQKPTWSPTQGPTQGPTQRPPTHGPPQGSCGKSFYQSGRVIAGTTAPEGAWPWQVLVKSGGRAGCGGSLISEKWVVTAAHCIRGSHSVVLGEHNRLSPSGHEEEIHASRAFAHPSYNRATFENDIALIELSRPAKIGTKYVNPVCLPDGDPPVGSNCYITGWGKTSSHGQLSTILQQAPMQVIDQDVCHRKNYAAIRIPIKPSMICGGGAGRISGCQGDSGGPFVCNLGGRWELHGAVSHGSRYCQPSETYTVFARVAKFRSWIRQHAGV